MDWSKLADDDTLAKTADSFMAKGIEVIIVNNREEAKRKVLELLPEGAEVMAQTSVTLDEISLVKEIEESGRFQSVRKRIFSIGNEEKRFAARRKAAAVDYAVGSVHAVTEEGQVVIASRTGSQLSPYAYSASNVIWVVGAQKIVKNLDQAFQRIREHVFPLEDARARKAYGIGSGINKILIVEKEVVPHRIKLILVKEKLGF